MDLISTFFNVQVLVASLPLLLRGLALTMLLGATSLLLAFTTAAGLVLARLYGSASLRWLARTYIDVFRAMPLLVLLVIVYYAWPFIGIRLPPFAAATVAISLVGSAYAAETFRAGIESVAKGQFEAGQVLGLSWGQMMRDVILPQALRVVVPPATGVGINLIKDTALASVVAMPDLLKQATQAQAIYANPSPLIGAAVAYLILLLPLVRLAGYMEGGGQRPARQSAW